MDKFKTRFLNQLRKVAMLSPIEKLLVRQTQHKTPDNFFFKLAPNNNQYPKNTLRNCSRDDIRYLLDISDYMQYCIYYGITIEPREKLYNLVKDGTTIIDVGTNIGETLLNFARINKTGLNIGFEPVPDLYARAEYNLKLNDLPNIKLENLALSNEAGKLTFNVTNENNSGGIFLSSDLNQEDSSRTVRAITLDSYVLENNLDNISLLKIDVEGFELNVLEGAVMTLNKFKPALFIELDDSFLRRQGKSGKELVGFLIDKGYQIFSAENDKQIMADENFESRHFDIVCFSQT